ncbi:MAG TPA: VCBS repeat-containing protein [Polyangiaceae bacterium]|jgi:MYXO-CTERM domain-containing protein
MLRHRSFLVFVVVGLLFTDPARADWPNARHDPQRTGVSASASDIVKPAVYWKAYVGGSLTPAALLVGDVNLDGSPDLVYVSGGSVVARSESGQLVWQTAPHDIQSLAAIDDFDGDGLPDVLAAGTSQAFLLAGKDGSFEWSESASDFGTLGGVRVGDFNGDTRPDVLAEECHCCAVTNGASGYAYTFTRSAGAIVATRLWSLPAETGDFVSCEVPSVLFDANGDGKIEIAHEGLQHVWVIGSDGSVLVNDTNSPSLGQGIYRGDCIPANVDGVPGDELVCFQATVYAAEPTPRQVYVLHYNSTPSSLSLLWQNTTLADPGPSGALDFEPNAVVDLDGNGTLEVVVAGLTGGVWTTYIFDANSGSTLATIPNARTAGTATLRSDKKISLLTTDAQKQNLTAWIFDPTQQPPIQTTWTQIQRQTMTRVDPGLLRTLRADQALVTPDLNQDGVDDLLTLEASTGAAIFDYAAPTGAATQVATFAFPNGVTPLATWATPPATASAPQVIMATSDGLLALYDDGLDPGAAIQAGGYCAGGAVMTSFGANLPQAVIVGGSQGALLRYDAQAASLANPPPPTWTVPNCTAPSVVGSLDTTNPGIVCRSTQQTPSLSALRGDGSTIWNVPMPDQGAIHDALPGSATGGAPTIFVQTGDSASNATTRALSGATGTQLWASTPVAIESGLSPFAVADWNADGVADVLTVLNTAQAISGASGQTLVAGTDFLEYGIPILRDVNNDGVLEFTLQANVYPARTLEHDLTTPLWVGPANQPLPSGAIADCPNGPQLLEGNLLNPSRLYLTQVAGASAGTAVFSVLAGGKQYTSEAAASADGSYLGQLSDLVIGNNLTGAGKPTAVVGSTDGWLYAVDACSGVLQFVVPFGESVCGAILGDTDANGRDEILVSTSGGYLYDVQNEELPSPAPVLDTDPPQGITTTDVDTISTQSTLFGTWQAVPGAASYEIAVAHQPEGIISKPPWQDAGTATSGSIAGLPLVAGQRYYFAARAVAPQGRSVDAISNGVTVIGGSDAGADAAVDGSTQSGEGGTDAGATPGSQPGSGCGCRTADSGNSGTLPIVIGTAAVVLGVRRRRKLPG